VTGSSAGTHPIGDLNGGYLGSSLSQLPSQFDGSSLNFNGLQAAGLDDGLRVGSLPFVSRQLLTVP